MRGPVDPNKLFENLLREVMVVHNTQIQDVHNEYGMEIMALKRTFAHDHEGLGYKYDKLRMRVAELGDALAFERENRARLEHDYDRAFTKLNQAAVALSIHQKVLQEQVPNYRALLAQYGLHGNRQSSGGPSASLPTPPMDGSSASVPPPPHDARRAPMAPADDDNDSRPRSPQPDPQPLIITLKRPRLDSDTRTESSSGTRSPEQSTLINAAPDRALQDPDTAVGDYRTNSTASNPENQNDIATQAQQSVESDKPKLSIQLRTSVSGNPPQEGKRTADIKHDPRDENDTQDLMAVFKLPTHYSGIDNDFYGNDSQSFSA